jgi:hypothetical protein
VFAIANSESDIRVSLNDESPLHGQHDVRVDFTFRNEGATPWQQWGFVYMGFAHAPVDLSEYSGIRLTFLTDQYREAGIELVSEQSEALDTAECPGVLGVTFYAGEKATVFEIAFEDAQVKGWECADGKTLEGSLSTMLGFNLWVAANGRTPSGLFPDGVTDTGFVQVDDLEFTVAE